MPNSQTGAPFTPEKPQIPAIPSRTEEAAIEELSPAEADLRARETLPETKDDILHAESKSELEAAKEEAAYQAAPAPARLPDGLAGAPKDEAIIEVEKILEQGIGPFYASLPAEAKPLFKKKGEEAANEIAEMVRTLKVKVKRILELIYVWLKTIPGVNKFFLEQEAKIKTDRILELIEARKEEASDR